MIDASTLRTLKTTYLGYRRSGATIFKATQLTCQKFPEHVARIRDLSRSIEEYGEPFNLEGV